MTGKRIAGISVKTVSIISMIAAGCIGVIYFGASASSLLIMAAFMLFYVLLPGCFIIKAADLGGDHISTFLARSFFTGFIVNILLYYVTDIIGINVLLYAAGPILSALCITDLIRSRAYRAYDLRKLIKGIPSGLFLFLALVFIYSFLTTQCTYIPPYKSAFESIKLDFGFHAGIINGLANDFPPDNPWVSGMTIHYHYFTEMLYSIPVRLFGIHSDEILLSCTPYIVTPVLGCALYSFFKEFTKASENHGFYCLSLILSNMFILKSYPSSWFLYHLFSNINNSGLGAAAMLTAIPVLKAWDPSDRIDSERSKAKYVVFLIAIVMLTTGIKGPMVVVLLGGMVGTVLLGLILRKLDWRAAVVTAVSSAAFLFVYVYVVGSDGSGLSNDEGGALFNPWEVTDIFFLKSEIMELSSSTMVRHITLLIALLIISLTAFIVPFVLGYLRELWMVLTGRKEFRFSRVTVYASCMVGYIALLVFNYSGHSQVYFGFASLIFVPVISFWFIEDISEKKGSFAAVIKAIFILCLCITTLTMAQDYIRLGSNAVKHYDKRDKDTNSYRDVSTEEYEGLVWLRDNTDEDSLIASDRYFSVSLEKYDYTVRGHNTHFAYAIYSERDQYLEGSGFSISYEQYDLREEMINNLELMQDPDYDGRGDLARSLDVDYVLVSKRFSDAGDLSNEDYTLVFSNDDMDIYKVLDKAS